MLWYNHSASTTQKELVTVPEFDKELDIEKIASCVNVEVSFSRAAKYTVVWQVLGTTDRLE